MSFINFKPKSKPSSGKISFLPGKKEKPKAEKPPASDISFLPGDNFKPTEQAQRVESTKPAEPTPSLDTLSTAQSAALAALPAPAAAALNSVWSSLAGNPQSQKHMLKLLEQGSLGLKSGDSTVVERLDELNDRRGDGYNTKYLTQQTVSLMAAPESVVSQGKYSTCAAANLQYQIALEPPLLTDVVEGLTDEQGRATLPSGAVLTRIPNSQHEDPSGRSLINRLLQNTLMTDLGEEKGTYEISTDTFQKEGEEPQIQFNPRNGTFTEVVVNGLKVLEIAKGAANVEGEAKAVVTHDSETHETFVKLFKSASTKSPMHVGASWEDQDHMLLYLGEKDGEAQIFNPQDKGLDTIEMDKLLFKAQFAIFSADHVEPVAKDLPEDAVYVVEPDKN